MKDSHQRHLRLVISFFLLYLCHKLCRRFKLAFLFMRWYFSYFAETPKLVYQVTKTNTKLLSYCSSITTRKYYPPLRLFNGHLQTIYYAYDHYGPIIQYRRQLLKLSDGGTVSLDWALRCSENQTCSNSRHGVESDALPWDSDIEPTRRTIVFLPGLTGDSSEAYIRSPIAHFNAMGWQCVVLNARGCAKTPVTSAQLFCCAYTEDLRFVLTQLSQKYKFAHEAFVCVGFSMGANVLVKYLGEEGEQTPLTGAISIGNPFELTLCSANFQHSLFHRLTYDKVLNSNLRELFFDKCNAAKQFEHVPQVNLDALKATRTVRDFDENLTKHVFHYDTVDDYYSDAGSVKKLGGVRVPLLCINAEDDPISINLALPTDDQVKANPNVILCTTKSGGHLAFYESSFKKWENGQSTTKHEPNMWIIHPIVEFAEALRQTKVVSSLS